MSAWGRVSSRQYGFLKDLVEAYERIPENKQRVFSIDFEMAGGATSDGTCVHHPGFKRGIYRLLLTDLNTLVNEGYIQVTGAPGPQCFEITERGFKEYERIFGSNSAPSTSVRLSVSKPFGNRIALRRLLRSAKRQIAWYEQHMNNKVLEVLYEAVSESTLRHIKLLSGPPNNNDRCMKDYKRFKRELDINHVNISLEWRVLQKQLASEIHGRFLFIDNVSWNIPPLNLILKGTEDEILKSDVTSADFNNWWQKGEELGK